MSNDMKLIMESWRTNILTEEPGVLHTYGDLKKALKDAIAVKKGEVQMDALKDTAAGALFDFIPGAATAKNLFDLGKTLYSLPDEKKTGTALDSLNVNDQVSAVVDDRIENQFIQKYLKTIDNIDDARPLETTNITKLLTNFIASEYDSTKVEPK